MNPSASNRHVRMGLRCAFILLLPLLTSAVESQEVLRLYSHYLPDGVLTNPEYAGMVSAKLEAKSKIHPELLYYIVGQLQNLFADSREFPPGEFNEYVHQVEQSYMSRRNEWARRLIHRLETGPWGVRVREAGIARLNEVVDADADGRIPPPDLRTVHRNVRDFYVVVYLEKDASLRYDPVAGRPDDLLGEIIETWYMYEDATREPPFGPDLTAADQIIGTVLSRSYGLNASRRFLVNAGYCFHNSMTALQATLPATFRILPSFSTQPPDYPDPSVGIDEPVQQFVGSFAYRLPLNEEAGAFSYVKFQVAASLSAGDTHNSTEQDNQSAYSVGVVDFVTSERLEYVSSIQTMNSYTVKVSVPLIALGNSFFIEGSVSGGLLQVQTSVDYRYAMTKTEGYIIDLGGTYFSRTIAIGAGAGTAENRENMTLVYPTLDVVFETGLGLELSFSANTMYAALLCGYRF